ncbi:MAG: hypothetical protein U1E76_27920 [Planctomycetota bacterium]
MDLQSSPATEHGKALPCLISARARGISVEYEAVGECATQSLLRLCVARAPRSGLLLVTLDRQYLDAVSIDAVVPPAHGVQSSKQGAVLAFQCAPNRTATITLHITFERPGAIAGDIGIEGGPSVPVVQWIEA